MRQPQCQVSPNGLVSEASRVSRWSITPGIGLGRRHHGAQADAVERSRKTAGETSQSEDKDVCEGELDERHCQRIGKSAIVSAMHETGSEI